jgi:autotransporter-associated beta strand protein
LTGVTLSEGALNLGADQNALTAANLNKGTVSGAGKLISANGINAAVGAGDTVTVAGDNLKGVLTKSGAGTVALNSTNTGLTGVTLSDGVLNLGADQATSGVVLLEKGEVSGTGRTLKGSGGITVNTASAVTVGVNLDGNLTKDGAGALILNGQLAAANTTTINSGKVAVGATGKLGTSGATTLNGGELSLGSDQTVSALNVNGGKVTGTGQVTSGISVELKAGSVDAKLVGAAGVNKTGAGTATLGSTNTYTGATNVTGGVLIAGATNALGGGEITVGTAGKVNLGGFNQTVTGATIGGELSNGVLDAGAGTVNVNTGATVSGVTVKASAGTVNLNGGAVSGSEIGGKAVKLGEVDVTLGKLKSDTQIVADNATAHTVSADITSANGLTKQGAGKLTLSGDNIGVNGLNVVTGTVEVTQQKSLGSGPVNIGSGATLTAQSGGGLLDISSPASSLKVNGTLTAKSVTVGAGQTLSGSGSVNAGVVLANGVIAPGNSSGTLTVSSLSGTGDYLWERVSLGTYDTVKLSAGGSDLTGITVKARNIAGDAIPVVNTLAGGESLARDQVLAGPERALRYAKIIDGSTTGGPRFGGVDTAVIAIRLVPTGAAGAAASSGIDLVVDRSSYAKFATTKGGVAYGAFLDSQLRAKYDDTDKTGVLLRKLDSYTSAADVAAALRVGDPASTFASTASVGVQRINAVASSLDSHLDVLGAEAVGESALNLAVGVAREQVGMSVPSGREDDKNWMAWTAGYGSRSTIEPDGNSAGNIVSSDTGASIGVERRLGNLRIGTMASMGRGSSNFESGARVESDHTHVGGYGSVSFGAVTVDASAMFGSSDLKSTASTTTGPERAKFVSNDRQLGLGVAVNLIPKSSGWQVTPVARLKLSSYKQDSFSVYDSNGAPVSTIGEVNQDGLLSKLGLRVAHRSEVSRGFTLGLDGSAYWVHDFNTEAKDISVQLAGANGAFLSPGRKGEADAAQLNLGVQATVAESVTFRLSGQQDIGVNRTQSTGMFAVGVSF